MAWLTLALESGYDAVLPRVEEVLAQVGRMKYLRPLYGAMVAAWRRDARARGGAVRARSRQLSPDRAAGGRGAVGVGAVRRALA